MATTKKQLEEILAEKEVYIKELEGHRTNMATQLSEALNMEHEFHLYGYSVLDFDKMIRRVYELRGEARVEGKARGEREYMLRQENAKLWYMVRLSMKDPDAKEPMETMADRPLVERPNFDA